MSYQGCSDGGCVFGHPGGMHTNGGCHCVDKHATPGERAALRSRIRAMALEHKAARVAWRSFRGSLVHDLRCGPPEIIGDMKDAAPDDPRCDCGVRELVSALGAL